MKSMIMVFSFMAIIITALLFNINYIPMVENPSIPAAASISAVCFHHGDIKEKPTKSRTLHISENVNFQDDVLRPFLFHQGAFPPFPDYMLATPSPEQDPFSARLIHSLNGREWHVEEAFAEALPALCKNGGKVIDAGANIGHTVALAASLGCRVVAYELQPRLHKLIKISALANDWDVTVRNGASHLDSQVIGPINYYPLDTMKGYRNAESFLSCSVGDCSPSPGNKRCITSVPLDNILRDLDGDLALVKLDVDSIELDLLQALTDKMKSSGHKIHNFILEGNNPRHIPVQDTAVYSLCLSGYSVIFLNSPNIDTFYSPILHLTKRISTKGYLGDAMYVKNCSSLLIVMQHVVDKFGGFIGNIWITKLGINHLLK